MIELFDSVLGGHKNKYLLRHGYYNDRSKKITNNAERPLMPYSLKEFLDGRITSEIVIATLRSSATARYYAKKGNRVVLLRKSNGGYAGRGKYKFLQTIEMSDFLADFSLSFDLIIWDNLKAPLWEALELSEKVKLNSAACIISISNHESFAPEQSGLGKGWKTLFFRNPAPGFDELESCIYYRANNVLNI